MGPAGVSVCLACVLTRVQAPLFEAIVAEVSPPHVQMNAPLQLLVTNLDYDEHKGRIAVGRVSAGRLTRAETVAIAHPGNAAAPLCPRGLRKMHVVSIHHGWLINYEFNHLEITIHAPSGLAPYEH